MKRVMGLAAVLAAVAGCGSAPETKSSGSPYDGAAELPTFPAGVYVASYDGSDTNDGSPLAPMRSINKAIDHAKATAQTDVWIYGGGFNNGSPEVVVLRAGINLHGSLCYTGTAPVQTDVTACRTSIAGGSPSLVAIDIHENTLVENVEILGLPGVQAGGTNDGFFEVAGIGCIGRGINSRLPSCERPEDAEGRMAPFSSVAVAISHSDKVYFRNVSAVAGDGASGLDGVEGVSGASATRPANALAAGDKPYKAGAGALSIAPAACPEAIGGKGGQGGRFRWTAAFAWSESVCTGTSVPVFCGQFFQTNFAHGGNQGEDSLLHTGMVTLGPAYQGFQQGAQGLNGKSALIPGAAGDAGLFGVREVDLVTLSAGAGARGDVGRTGPGGAGGSGGNPATREIYNKDSGSSSSNVSLIAIGGSSSGAYSGQTVQTEVGELPGGGGGAGGAGGCGGTGGVGGQGGASSVGVYLVDSILGMEQATVTTGRGGSGGRGGTGGEGGIGANGSEGGAGRAVASSLVVGTLTNSSGGGFFNFSGSSQLSASWEDGRSAARSGKGGTGGTGAKGGKGGAGGSGAGGSSIGVVAKGASTITGTVTYELGAWGDAGDETGEAGQAIQLLSL